MIETTRIETAAGTATETVEQNQSRGTLGASCPLPLMEQQQVVMGHGSGGKLTADLIEKVFIPAFRNPLLEQRNDQAIFQINGARLAFTTDSFVITPIFFPGGNIGDLAINGTVNDLAMGGARPLYLSAAFILEEGLPMEELRRVVASMQRAADEAGVQLVTGDTKVVDRGKGDKVFITTTGVGIVELPVDLSAANARPGDRILVSGYLGDHGMAILSQREHLEFEGTMESDTAPLHTLVQSMLEASTQVRCLRDPTRGGLATTLKEIAATSGVGMKIQEKEIPIRETVRGACELLGLDPLYVANEGKLVAIVAPEAAGSVLAAMRAHPYGCDARLIGEVIQDVHKMVLMKTEIGGTRVLDTLFGEQLPRIC
jgi:hydrogenase expression/formation protein HypE